MIALANAFDELFLVLRAETGNARLLVALASVVKEFKSLVAECPNQAYMVSRNKIFQEIERITEPGDIRRDMQIAAEEYLKRVIDHA